MDRLVNHMRSHTCEQPLIYHVCGESFRLPYSFDRHKLLQHGLGKWWQCNFCEAKKYTQDELNRHIRSKHTRDKFLQKCYFCSMRLVKVTPRHMSIHTGEKHFKCLHCPAEYRKAVAFQIHVLEHHRDTPEFDVAKAYLSKVKNICYFCQKPFNCSANLLAHMKEHTKEKSEKCNHCGLASFSRSDAVKSCIEHTPQSSLYFKKGQEL